jgi:hypothetical protein
MASSFTFEQIYNNSAAWTRLKEPSSIPCKWEENDIVIEFNCCNYPVKVGCLTEENKQTGFVLFSHLPAQCPCACKHAYGHTRKPRTLISPQRTIKTDEEAIQWWCKQTYTSSPRDITIYLDSYFVQPVTNSKE